ncbi:hypothetical protein LU290_05860 [Moraxella nasibovis]|uniref:hypothetical protein n=1 Tax=Moraxella nasibovis TaxID=2904120 RepID=UPI00241085FA|nr:hypothetical protein [Moraxella nasibovis]WFF37801.1 hypothetical protein LU290_05860 [Moraxella nasibovis]
MRFNTGCYQISLLAILCLGGIAHADIPFAKDDLVGKWRCHTDDPELKFRSESVVETRADGTQSENSTMYLDDEDFEFYQIDQVHALAKWRLDDDVMTSYDTIIRHYKVDVPNYDEQSMGVSKDAFVLLQTIYGRAEIEAVMTDELPAHIKFIDKNTYTWADVGEDFMSADRQYCTRLDG